MAGPGISPQSGAAEEYRRRLRELLRAQPGMLMNILEAVAASEEREPLRGVVEAAMFIFAGAEDSLPGGRDFWDRMRSNIPPPAGTTDPAAEREAGWVAVARFRQEMDNYASSHAEVRRALAELDRHGPPPPPRRPPTGGEPLAQPVAGPQVAPPPPLQQPGGVGVAPAAPPFAHVIPPRPEPAGGENAAGCKARAEMAESELARKDLSIKDIDAELRRLRDELRKREEAGGNRALEEKLAVHEEEGRLARAALAKLEKKYRENLELLKEEARDRGSLQKRLDSSQAEVLRAQERLKDEQEKLSDASRRLEKRERELETLEERLHSMELELVRKEEEISMAMQHLRDEEAERRRVLEALRQEARDKAQMEHRLKRREEELSRLEARIVEEEKRISALRGSQAISEEEALRKAGELHKREEEVRAAEAAMHGRLEALRSEEEDMRGRISLLKRELRDGEVLEAQLRKREELRAALEERYRKKEDELVRELKELERLKAVFGVAGGPAEAVQGAAGSVAEGGWEPPSDVAPPGEGPEEAGHPVPAEPAVPPATPARLFPDTERPRDHTPEELLDMLARKKKAR